MVKERPIVKCKYCEKEFMLSRDQFTKYNKNPEANFFCCRGHAISYGSKCVDYNKRAETMKNLYKDKNFIEARTNKTKETNLKKYGVENVSQVKEFNDKIKLKNESKTLEEKQQILDKRSKTKLEKYGDVNYNNREQAKETNLKKYGVSSPVMLDSTIEKRKKASLEKYGVDNPLKNKEVRELGKNTIKEKYGVNEILSSPKVREKIKQTLLNKYGVENIMQSKKYKSKFKNTMLERYNVTSGFLTPNGVNSHKHGTISKLNKEFVEFIKPYVKQDINLEKSIVKFIYDIQIEDTLIDLNPTISHNTYISYPYRLSVVKENKPVSKDYHLDRTLLAKEYNYNLISIFDWDDWEKIKYLIQEKETLYARKLHLKEVSQEECTEFLNKYHLQNTCRGQIFKIGLYADDNILIQLMTFGKPRYNKNYEWELLRLCTHKDYKVVGGAEKLFKYFISVKEPNSIISYCDLSKFSGDVYTRLGFKQKGKPTPSKHWSRNEEHYTDNILRQRGYDQIFKTNYGKGIDNEELMLQNGWLPIYDCGQLTFVWNK